MAIVLWKLFCVGQQSWKHFLIHFRYLFTISNVDSTEFYVKKQIVFENNGKPRFYYRQKKLSTTKIRKKTKTDKYPSLPSPTRPSINLSSGRDNRMRHSSPLQHPKRPRASELGAQ